MNTFLNILSAVLWTTFGFFSSNAVVTKRLMKLDEFFFKEKDVFDACSKKSDNKELVNELEVEFFKAAYNRSANIYRKAKRTKWFSKEYCEFVEQHLTN